MNNNFPIVPLEKVLKQRNDFIEIDDFKTYKRCRVQLHAQGIVERDIIQGVEIRTKRQQVCYAGEFLVAEIDAKVGGFGIVPDILEGAIVSSHYFLFNIDETYLNRKFLDYYISTPTFMEQVRAQGSTNYAAIRPANVLAYKIPLPPLTEQCRIVARIEELASRIEEARGLKKGAVEEGEALVDSALRYMIQRELGNSDWKFGPIPLFAEINPSRKGQTNFASDLLVSFVPMAAVNETMGYIAHPEVRPFSEVAKGYTWFLNGDVIFARITPCMENGKVALAENLVNNVGFGSTEFHVLRPNHEITGKWLHYLLKSKDFRDDAAAHFKGTAGQQRVPQSFLEQKTIPVPPVDEQQRIVAHLGHSRK